MKYEKDKFTILQLQLHIYACMFDKLVRILSNLTKYLFRAYTAWSNGHQSKHGNKEIFGESRAIKTCFLFFFSGNNDSVRGKINLILTVPHHSLFQVYSLLSLPGSIH